MISRSIDDLKKVADDIAGKKGRAWKSKVLSHSAGMDGSSDWRFKTHLANLPIYYEYKDEESMVQRQSKEHTLTTTRDLCDLYITDSTCDGSDTLCKNSR